MYQYTFAMSETNPLSGDSEKFNINIANVNPITITDQEHSDLVKFYSLNLRSIGIGLNSKGKYPYISNITGHISYPCLIDFLEYINVFIQTSRFKSTKREKQIISDLIEKTKNHPNYYWWLVDSSPIQNDL